MNTEHYPQIFGIDIDDIIDLGTYRTKMYCTFSNNGQHYLKILSHKGILNSVVCLGEGYGDSDVRLAIDEYLDTYQ
jgi:hypothetical protein